MNRNLKKTILLTGATGSVGIQVLRELLKRKNRYKIRVISLRTKNDQKLLRPYADRTEIFWGDLRNQEDVNKAVTDVDVVLHVAAIIPPIADHQPQLAYDVNVEGTRNLLTEALDQPKPARFIFTSSISVYGDRLDNPYIIATDKLHPSLGDEYAKTKIIAEELVRHSKLDWTILRLCGILTPKLKYQPLMFHMPLDTALEWCHYSDIGYALANAVECDEIIGQVYNLGGGKKCQVSARDFLHSMLPLFGIDPANLPEYAFAIRNFHSGYYIDGYKLNTYLRFQRRSLDEYFREIHRKIPSFQRNLVKLLPGKFMVDYFLKMSEPFQAILANNQKLITRFYGSREAFENILNAKPKTKYGKI